MTFIDEDEIARITGFKSRAKKPIDHFSLSDWRKSITEHAHPLFTLTKAEMEGMVGRLEKAREILRDSDDLECGDYWSTCAQDWLASLEREDNK